MTTKESNTTWTSRMGIADWMFIVLFSMKLGLGDTGVQQMSWWWVTSPLWISFIVLMVFGIIAVAVKK